MKAKRVPLTYPHGDNPEDLAQFFGTVRCPLCGATDVAYSVVVRGVPELDVSVELAPDGCLIRLSHDGTSYAMVTHQCAPQFDGTSE